MALERAPAPALDVDLGVGGDPDRVARQQVDDDLEVVGVAQLDQGRAGEDHGLAFLDEAQDLSVDRRQDVDAAGLGLHSAVAAARQNQRGPGRLQLEGLDLERRLGGGDRGAPSLGGELGLVETALGQVAARGQGPGPVQLAFGELELGAGPFELGLGQGQRRLGRSDHGHGLGLGALVEQGRRDRSNARQHGLAGDHWVARLLINALQAAGQGRGDQIDVAHPGVALLVDGHPQGPAVHLAEVDRHWLGPEHVDQAGEQQDAEPSPKKHTCRLRRHACLNPLFSIRRSDRSDRSSDAAADRSPAPRPPPRRWRKHSSND
jgi:hypothetical protein